MTGKPTKQRSPKSAARGRKAPKLDWTIEMRVKPTHAELVEVPRSGDQSDERVIRVLRGRTLPRRKGTKRRGLLSDVTGRTALDAFRIAVREAKRQ